MESLHFWDTLSRPLKNRLNFLWIHAQSTNWNNTTQGYQLILVKLTLFRVGLGKQPLYSKYVKYHSQMSDILLCIFTKNQNRPW